MGLSSSPRNSPSATAIKVIGKIARSPTSSRTFSRSTPPRRAIVCGSRKWTYAELDRDSTRLALNLVDLGLKPLDRVVLQLPNVAEFALIYFALQKIGAIPIMALATHRYRELSQFVQLSGAVACVAMDATKDYDFASCSPE